MKFLNFLIYFLFIFLFIPWPVFALVDINSASLSELDQLTGIGPAYAQRIIDGRPYSSVDDLDRVKGIGPATLQKIKDQGLACVSCGSAPVTQEKKKRPDPPETPLNGGEVVVSSLVEVEPPKTYTTGIFINEIMPSPLGADETDEWIELYNSNNIESDLSGWKLNDSAGTNASFVFPENFKIAGLGFKVVKRPDTKIILNNDGDSVYLIYPDGKTADSASYQNAKRGQSYSKTSSGWQWNLNPTPGDQNVIQKPVILAAAVSPAVNKQIESKGLPKDQKSVNLSDINQKNNPWFLFFTALSISIMATVLLIFIKLKYLK